MRRRALDAALVDLDGELALMLVFLESYRRSGHPERREALRWQLPLLRRRLALLRALGGVVPE